MRVRVEVEEIEMDGDHCIVPGIRVSCTQCDECVEVFGRSSRSLRRGCTMLKEMCDSRNYYYCDDYSGDDE